MLGCDRQKSKRSLSGKMTAIAIFYDYVQFNIKAEKSQGLPKRLGKKISPVVSIVGGNFSKNFRIFKLQMD
ncbi:MAG TPA: hypothetical protein DEG17_13380 [Cyanobacteria bacterium UBA11149]|nr:hypothetical protein [Cyanobacteria bacterium UBA11367]HBE56074.1 hypothetical protein [Cyanobacteria bacterium UBA11366]HBK64192.1 hypothetical protein [Cyanobacteria bacterium UBA11166]HBR75527.1 hypothetical protein [Cyanobacteria bacterium UBA11159]HBS71608.1 hypothetical protein [Cyanobacteria bacterium UBA11153]HBW89833.1 hypothetical protein [Cyanobacteria bacterium UBA11149]HCA94200.1 hypothetical protein [Cyanobacteria bacterium UBA9226]